MKRIFLMIISAVMAFESFAGTPAEDLVGRHADVKGARHIEVRGARMKFARPILKRFPIGPLADSVTEVTVLDVDRTSPESKERFLGDLALTLRQYRYSGKSDTPNGLVDVYVHLYSDSIVDELVIFNPESNVLNILDGRFSVEDLIELSSSNDK